jgi:hypothetical protein
MPDRIPFMKLYRFDPAAGMAIDAYGSSFLLAPLARSDGTTLLAAWGGTRASCTTRSPAPR